MQSDIRLAKRAQSLEEERARARGILTEAEKRQVEYIDRQIAEQYQQENIERYLECYFMQQLHCNSICFAFVHL